jgi:hypothetical protein
MAHRKGAPLPSHEACLEDPLYGWRAKEMAEIVGAQKELPSPGMPPVADMPLAQRATDRR